MISNIMTCFINTKIRPPVLRLSTAISKLTQEEQYWLPHISHSQKITTELQIEFRKIVSSGLFFMPGNNQAFSAHQGFLIIRLGNSKHGVVPPEDSFVYCFCKESSSTTPTTASTKA